MLSYKLVNCLKMSVVWGSRGNFDRPNSFKALNEDSNLFDKKISYPVSTSSVYKMHLKISFKNTCRSSGLRVTLQSADVSHQMLKAKHQAGERQLAEFLKHCSWDQSYLHLDGCRCHRKHLWLWDGLTKQSDHNRGGYRTRITSRTGVTEMKWNSKAKIKHLETKNKSFTIKSELLS